MIKHILTFCTKNPTKKRILVSDEDFFLVKVENSDHTESCIIDMDETSDFTIVDSNEFSTTYKFTPNPAGDTELKVRLGGSTQLQDLTITRQDLDIGHSDTASAADVASQLEAVDEEIAEVKKEVISASKAAWQKGGSYVQNSGFSIGDSKGNMAINLDAAEFYGSSENGQITFNGLNSIFNTKIIANGDIELVGGILNLTNYAGIRMDSTASIQGGGLNLDSAVIGNMLAPTATIGELTMQQGGITADDGTIKGKNLASTLDLNVGRTANLAGNCNVFGDLAVAANKTIKIGSTSIAEDQLKKLLALI